MFNEKNLPRLIIATPIVTVLLFALLIIYFFVNTQYSNFQEESIELEREYILRQKNILKNENKKILEYIDYHRNIENKRIYDEFRERANSGHIIENQFLEEYEKQSIDKLKTQVISWIESIRYGTNGYVWVHDTNHHLVAHPFRKESIGNDDTNNSDASGAKIFQQFINTAKQNRDGGFVEYYWAKPEFGAPRKKIGFLSLDKEWGWVVGTGLYVDDIESSIAKKKKILEAKIDKYVRIILLVALSIMIILGLLSFLISQNILKVIDSYRQKVSKKEQALKDFNKTLTTRVEEALYEAKKKDRALLQKSRLAQMGEMISMIAHQWRQPLSEIGGIFMELETASKFKKADDAFIKEASSDANRLLSYMSKTIDDFRYFFKPSKKEELFFVSRACDEALTLAEASLKNNHIHVELHVNKDVSISGYPAEYAQVILNLILNARDILIERNIENPSIKIAIDVEGNKSAVSISDNGGGVDEEIIERIFEPYFSTKKKSGTGLGLYMSKMIVEENMGGKLTIKNSDIGAVFFVRIKLER